MKVHHQPRLPGSPRHSLFFPILSGLRFNIHSRRENLEREARKRMAEKSDLAAENGDETELLLHSSPPRDDFHLAYIVYFILGAGFLVPWNAFITAVDYFSYVYPGVQVDRVFAVGYMFCALIFIIIMVGWWAHRSGARIRINIGLGVFVLSLMTVPALDLVYVRGRPGFYAAYDITVGAVLLAGIGDALVQGGIIGSAGELPERYMQSVVAGTAASGNYIALLRISPSNQFLLFILSGNDHDKTRFTLPLKFLFREKCTS